MKAYVFSAPNEMVWKDLPSPQLSEPYGAILSPVAISPCTSDVHTVFGGGRGMAGKTIHTELAKGGRARVERMLKMVQYKRIDPQPLVTHTFYGLENIQTAFLLTKEKPADLIKAAVIIDEVIK